MTGEMSDHLISDRLRRFGANFAAAAGTERARRASPKQFQEIVDLCDLAKALTLFFFPFLEPTGDNRFTRCGLQILWNRHPFAGVIPSASEGPHSSSWRRSRSPSPSVRFGMTEWKRKRNRQRVSGLESRGKVLALLV